MCPGRTGKKCGVFMSPLIRDPHIHCPRCRGNKCSIDNTCIICNSWPPEQWDLFAKKKSYAHSKSRRGRSKSMSASPAPSVAGTSDVRPSVPPTSLPPSRDQVVMGGQTSAGVTFHCHGSAPSGSVTMATSEVSDDVVPASSDLPPTSGGEGGQKKQSPACSPIPGLSSNRPLSPVRREKRLDPSDSSLAGPPPCSPSVERERVGRRRGERSLSPSSPSLYRSCSRSGERREGGSGYCQRSRERRDRSGDGKRSRRSRFALLIGSILKSVHVHALANLFTVESAPVIVGTHVSTTPVIPQSAPSTVLGLGTVPTAPELLRSEAIDRNAVVRAPHRFWGNRRSDVTSVPCVKCFRALCQASRSLWTPLGMMQAIRRPLALPLVGPRCLKRSGQRRVCPRHVRVERLAPALALLPVDQTAPLVIVANHLPEREGAAVPRL